MGRGRTSGGGNERRSGKVCSGKSSVVFLAEEAKYSRHTCVLNRENKKLRFSGCRESGLGLREGANEGNGRFILFRQ